MNQHETTAIARATTIDRRHDLDALRAIAMLLGIVLHAALSFSSIPWVVQDTRQHEAFSLVFFGLHGFRIPLFFLISGFFTAMLWEKRGLKSLIWNRFKRIFLPLSIGLITIIPINNWIIQKAWDTNSQPTVSSESTTADTSGETIWSAAWEGNLEALQRQIDTGAPINTPDPNSGLVPLSVAALANHPEAVNLLLEKGADVNALNADGSTVLHGIAFFGQAGLANLVLQKGANVNALNANGNTPLHNAAFAGHAQVAQLLLQHGADPTVRNQYGATPLDTLSTDKKTTLFIASLLKTELDWETVQKGREATAEIMKHFTGMEEQGGQTDVTGMLWYLLFQRPTFQHLWFLSFLCWLVVGFIMFAIIADRLKLKVPSNLVLSPVRYLWLIPLTLIPQVYMFQPVFGADTSDGLLPMPHVLLYYAAFFGFGALYYATDDKKGTLGRRYRFTLPLALFLVFPLGLEFMYGGFGLRDSFSPAMQKRIANLMQVAFAWLMTFGSMGLFRAWMSRENKTMRYLSDSSYWLYLAHLPLVIWGQMIVRDWPIPAFGKFLLICVMTTVFLLFTYRYLVRYTPIGTLLNGPRKRPA